MISRLLFCRPIPDREFVETYVKAFYLTENEMERWMREHKVPCLSCLGGAENHINQNKIWHSLTELLFLMKTFLSRPISERTVSKKIAKPKHSSSSEETRKPSDCVIHIFHFSPSIIRLAKKCMVFGKEYRNRARSTSQSAEHARPLSALPSRRS